MLWIPLVCTPSKLRNPALCGSLGHWATGSLASYSTFDMQGHRGEWAKADRGGSSQGGWACFILYSILFCQILPTRWSTVTNVRKREVEDDLEKPYPPLKLTLKRHFLFKWSLSSGGAMVNHIPNISGNDGCHVLTENARLVKKRRWWLRKQFFPRAVFSTFRVGQLLPFLHPSICQREIVRLLWIVRKHWRLLKPRPIARRDAVVFGTRQGMWPRWDG